MLSLSKFLGSVRDNLVVHLTPQMLAALTAQVKAECTDNYVGPDLESNPRYQEILAVLPHLSYRWDSKTETLTPIVPETAKKCVSLLARGNREFRPMGRFLDLRS